MALKCRCICGCKLLVALDSAGKRIKCPKCERKLRVPVDLVEKRRAQLEARQPDPTSTPARSKIEKPLSSFVDLPEPEAPPILIDANETTTTPPSPLRDALAQPTPTIAKPQAAVDTPRKPPPLPKRNADEAKLLSEPVSRQITSDAVEDKSSPLVAPETLTTTKNKPSATQDASSQAPRLPTTDDVELPVRGYVADRKHVATVRWLAAAILLTGLVGTVPAIIDIIEHVLSDTSSGLSRWACALLLVGLLQSAYAIYLVQLPDWSSVWVVTIFTLGIAACYAAMFGLTLLSSDQGQFVQLLDLADRLRGGKATGWCLIMLSLMGLVSYFSGQVGTRWRNALVG